MIFKKISNLWGFLLLSFIFTTYFCSAVGLINSGDTPQYFTTEALINNRTIDISSFSDDPHFFIWPDYWQKDNQVLAIRGYFLSMLSIPIHVISFLIQDLFSLQNFPVEIISDDFSYKLSITALFTLFSVGGLIFIWKLLLQIDDTSNSNQKNHSSFQNKSIASVIILGLAFGTYAWKYSTYYARHGASVFLVGLFSYCSWHVLKNKDLEQKLKWLLIYALGISLSFGLDIILFLSSGISFLLLSYLVINQKNGNSSLKYFWNSIKKSIFYKSLIGLTVFVFCLNLVLNLYWYDSPLFVQNTRVNVLITKLSQDKLATKDWLSTPLFPTIFYVLFSGKELPASVFSNYQNLPNAYAVYGSIEWAQRYIFYGLFFISPFLLWSIFSILIAKKQTFQLVAISFFQFLLTVILNTKTLCFWGGNQYDVRYFYPYLLFLAFPLSFFLKNVATSKNKFYKYSLFFLFSITLLFSVLMGFLGVINMFKPALTGERRIFLDIYQISKLMSNYSTLDLLNASLLNRENWILPILLSVFSLCLWQVRKLLMKNIKK